MTPATATERVLNYWEKKRRRWAAQAKWAAKKRAEDKARPAAEAEAMFEAFCKKHGITQVVNPPHRSDGSQWKMSVRLNGYSKTLKIMLGAVVGSGISMYDIERADKECATPAEYRLKRRVQNRESGHPDNLFGDLGPD